MGHGIGARLIEYPSIFRPELMEYDEALEEGMIICLEPSTYVELDDVVVSLKDENQYVVEANGLRKLTPCGRAID
jgi:Xaa-Pro aminopeptidase